MSASFIVNQIAFLCWASTALAGVVNSSDISAGSSAFATSDGCMTISTIGSFGSGSSYFGVSGGLNSLAIDDQDGLEPADERVTFEFAPDAGLSGLDVVWTRAVITITGFAADPSGNFGSYDAASGTWSVVRPWTAGTTVSYRFSNVAASAGRSLSLTALDPSQPGPQISLVAVHYAKSTALPSDAVLLADPSAPAQVLEHFGASMFWTIDPTVGWPTATKERLALKLISQADGIGLSSLRFDFGGGDKATGNQSSQPWSWRFPVVMKDGAASPFDWSRRAGQQWFLRRARDMGVNQLTLASLSPPHWMTKNGRTFCSNLVGSTNLSSTRADEYADYLTEMLLHFRDSEGITFHHVSPVNEPEWSWEDGSQEGNRATAEDIRTLVKSLHSKLTSAGLAGTTSILTGEHAMVNSLLDDSYHLLYNGGSWNGGNNSLGYGKFREYLKDLQNHPDMVGKIDPVAAYHSYFTDDPTTLASNLRRLLAQNARARGTALMQSEYCILGSYGNGRDLQFEPARRVFQVIHKDLTVAGVTGWSWWLALSPHDYKDGLVYTNFNRIGSPSPRLFDSKVLWVLGNFSRFIRPGFQRIGSGGHDDLAGLMSSAWKSPDGREFVIIAGNLSNESLVVDLPERISGTDGSFHGWEPWVTDRGRNLRREGWVKGQATLAPQSVTTFVGKLGFSPFRLTVALSATGGNPSTVSARAAYEDGVFIMPGISPATEWVFQPTLSDPTGILAEGRYFIRRKSDGAYLAIGNDLGQEGSLALQELHGDACAWDVRPSVGEGIEIRHPLTGRVLAQEPAGVVARRAGGTALSATRVDPPATYEWRDKLGDGSWVSVPSGVERWVQVVAKSGNDRATNRLRVVPMARSLSISGLPNEIFSLPGHPVTLRAQASDSGRPWRFRIVPVDRDNVIRPGIGSELAMNLPVGAESEQWELVEPDEGRVWLTAESGRLCWIRSVTTGLCLIPLNGSSLQGTGITQAIPSGNASKWMIDASDGSSFRIRHPQSGLVLNISGSSSLPILWPDTNAGNDRFHLDSIDEDPLFLTWSHALGGSVSQTVSPQATTTYTVRANRGGTTVAGQTTVVVRELFAEWCARWFGSAVTPDPDGDADGDGNSNLLEYAFGSHPLQPDSNVGWSAISAEDQGLLIDWKKNREALGLWQIDWSENLSIWQSGGNPSIEIIEDTSDRLRVRVSKEEGRKLFVRLRFNAT